MRIKILIGAINEKGLGKLQKDQEYDVSDAYAKAYLKNGWAEIVIDPEGEPSDLQAGVTEKPSAKTANEEEVVEEPVVETEEEVVVDKNVGSVADLEVEDADKENVGASKKKGDTNDGKSKKQKKSDSKPKRIRS